MAPKATVAKRPATGFSRLPPTLNKIVAAKAKISINIQLVTTNKATMAEISPIPDTIAPNFTRCSICLVAIPISSLRADIGEIRRVRRAGTRADTKVTPVPTKNAIIIVRGRMIIVSSGMLRLNKLNIQRIRYANPTPAPIPTPDETSPTTVASPMTVLVI